VSFCAKNPIWIDVLLHEDHLVWHRSSPVTTPLMMAFVFWSSFNIFQLDMLFTAQGQALIAGGNLLSFLTLFYMISERKLVLFILRYTPLSINQED
jgi:hypothetical protein